MPQHDQRRLQTARSGGGQIRPPSQFLGLGEAAILQTIDLGDAGLIPLEVRFHHAPSSKHGFVGAALSSAIWHWHQDGNDWKADKVIQVDPVNRRAGRSLSPA